MSETARPVARPHRRGLGAILLEFLGSMNLAIALLLTVAIASVIGTVILQNQPVVDYVTRFGGFWFEVFRVLGLYDVYGTAWFLGILAFLVLSTSVCIYRNAPGMLREMRHYRVNARRESLRGFSHRQEWELDLPAEEAEARAAAVLGAHKYRMRRKDHGDHVVVAGMRGTFNRIGYLFTHAAVVIICIGGLIDGNVGLKLKAETGELVPLKQDMLVADIPPASRLQPGETLSFRGNRTIPEGAAVNGVILNLGEGYVLQELPFAIEVKDFRIEYYPTGQPKSFESDLVIHDDRLQEPLEQTIAVNHPLIYRGYAIYQSSFGDGGTELEVRAWPLFTTAEPFSIDSAVFENHKLLSDGEDDPVLEFTDFRMFNINPEENPDVGKKFRNWGPSFTYKLRKPTGEANEYHNFMLPVERDGRLFYMLGVRTNPGEEFRYLRLPMDPGGGMERFMAFHKLLQNPQRLEAIIDRSARETFAQVEEANPDLHAQLVRHLTTLLADFAKGGMDAVLGRMQREMNEQQMQTIGTAYLQALRGIVAAVYLEVLKDEGVDVDGELSAANQQYFDDAFEALSVLPNYDSPVLLQLQNFRQIEATGLQITHAPGKNLVYLGCVLLIAGVFVMFYLHHQRAWLYVDRSNGRTRLLFAAASNRRGLDFDRRFQELRDAVGAALDR